MFAGMTSAETVGRFALVLLVGLPAAFMLATWAAFNVPTPGRIAARARELWKSYRRDDGTLSHELGSYSYREPADPSYVDELIRVRATAPVFHRPDPAPAMPVDRPYRVSLADLLEGSRYVVPATPAAAPTSPAPPVGRHRRELLAA